MLNGIDELKIFSLTLYFEAGSTCDIQEVLHIAYVIRNRVEKKRRFGKTYAEVCLQKWQFSCWNNKTLADIKKIELNNFRYLMCTMVAEYVKDMTDKFIPEEMRGVCFYYEPTLCSPKWARKLKRVYPSLRTKHIFFREK